MMLVWWLEMGMDGREVYMSIARCFATMVLRVRLGYKLNRLIQLKSGRVSQGTEIETD